MKTYDDIFVRLEQATANPAAVVAEAMHLTMTPADMKMNFCLSSAKGIKAVAAMGHTSVLEHVWYSFLILGASRNFLAQVTRHRIGSFTSGSQHYQEYSKYEPTVIDKNFADRTEDFFSKALALYSELLAEGWPKEEARQVLPGAMSNNLLWTVNARSLLNFFPLRLCYRNVTEMRKVANKCYEIVMGHFPELFVVAIPPCVEEECAQGKMACKNGPWERGRN